MTKESRSLIQPPEAYQRMSAQQRIMFEEWAKSYECQPIFYETQQCICAEVECAPDLYLRKYFTVSRAEERTQEGAASLAS